MIGKDDVCELLTCRVSALGYYKRLHRGLKKNRNIKKNNPFLILRLRKAFFFILDDYTLVNKIRN